MALRIINQQTQPIILVDWSDLDPRKQHFLLRASVAIEGRSLTLLEKIYTVRQKEKPTIHSAFMETLKAKLYMHSLIAIANTALCYIFYPLS